MDGEQQVAEKQRVGCRIRDYEIVIGMRRLLGLADEATPAQIELQLVLHQHGGQHDLRAFERLVAEHQLVGLEIAIGPHGERAL